jgi:hypothetical protein
MRGEDRRLAAGEEREEARLGPLEAEDHGMRIGRLDGLDVGVPVLPGIDPELLSAVRRLPHEIEGELDIPRGERLPVMPLHVLAEEEHQVPVVVLPRPLLGQLRQESLRRLQALGGIEDHQVAEAGARGPDHRDGGRLVDVEA